MSPLTVKSERISPTAYVTGYFWYSHGMSHEALATRQGRLLHYLFRPLIVGTHAVGGLSMDALMLARHRGIDSVLARAIEEGRVRQVIEVAAGLSPRGWDFMRRYGDRLTYIETDLPQMAALKRGLLTGAGLLASRHRVVELNALEDSGPQSIFGIAETLDPKLGTAIVAEGLLNYFDAATAAGVWRRFAEALRRFSNGVYLSDLYLQSDHDGMAGGIFKKFLSSFVRGRIHVHFESRQQAIDVMSGAGFSAARIHETSELPATRDIAHIRGADRVQVLEASCGNVRNRRARGMRTVASSE
jgi:O-methyltransferase involved in polyketide biosynthesis